MNARHPMGWGHPEMDVRHPVDLILMWRIIIAIG